MKICRFTTKEFQSTHLGVLTDQGDQVVDLTSLGNDSFNSFSAMVLESEREGIGVSSYIRSLLERSGNLQKLELSKVVLKIPFNPPEVWGAGITYLRSRDAREVETSLKGLYNYVYDAKRPEIFFKTTGLRCVGPGEDVGIRSDSKWSVPEPELTVVFGSNHRVIGYTIGNDMSARDIEGENPLYLPQAKIFKNCCALGPVVTTADEIPDPRRLEIKMTISRNGKIVFEGSVSTSKLKRTLDELVGYLKSNNILAPCSAFMTGVGIVPPDDFTLIDNDLIEIDMEKIGKLRNTARVIS